MTGGAAVIFEERVAVPVSALSLEGFRQWARSAEFPEEGRIDFVAGTVEIEMSPEDLLHHGLPKTAIVAALHGLVAEADRGEVYADRARLTTPAADLSAEPDAVVVLWSSLRDGRVRYVPAPDDEPDRYIEIEGAPDLVVEVVSKTSVRKDTERLPRLYARAGVPEFWLVDARGREITFEVRCLGGRDYDLRPADRDGWVLSSLLDRFVRLTRQRTPAETWRYRLEHRAPAPA